MLFRTARTQTHFGFLEGYIVLNPCCSSFAIGLELYFLFPSILEFLYHLAEEIIYKLQTL